MPAVKPDNVDKVFDDKLESMLDDKLAASLRKLKKSRDALRVKANLGAKEIRDEWQRAEKRWQYMAGKIRQFSGEARDIASELSGEITTVGHLLADDIKHGYARISDKMAAHKRSHK